MVASNSLSLSLFSLFHRWYHDRQKDCFNPIDLHVLVFIAGHTLPPPPQKKKKLTTEKEITKEIPGKFILTVPEDLGIGTGAVLQ